MTLDVIREVLPEADFFRIGIFPTPLLISVISKYNAQRNILDIKSLLQLLHPIPLRMRRAPHRCP